MSVPAVRETPGLLQDQLELVPLAVAPAEDEGRAADHEGEVGEGVGGEVGVDDDF